MGEKRRAFNVMVRKPEGNRPHRKPRFRLEGCVIQDSELNVTLRRVRVTIIAVQKQKLLHRVFACRLIYPSCKAMRNTILSSVLCLALPYFLNYLINSTIFGKNLLNVKSVF